MLEAMKKVIGEATPRTGRVKLELPPLIENGNSVSMTVAVESPMTTEDYVKAIHVFNEKNPQPNVISVHIGPRAGQGRHRNPHPARRFAASDRDRRDERRLVLVGRDGGHRDARSLPGGALIMARTLINVPPKAKRGDIVEIKTLISHEMESGYRPDNVGRMVPRDVITSFVATYNGEEIFRAELHPAIAANPFISFSTVATETGKIEFKWTGDNGFAATESASITVE